MTAGPASTDVDEIVELVIPAAAELVTLARFCAATVASRAGFDVDEIEDLRLAVDELCAAVAPTGSGSIQITLRRDRDLVRIRCIHRSARAPDSIGADWQPTDLAEQLLASLVDDHGFERHVDGPCGWLEKRGRTPSVR